MIWYQGENASSFTDAFGKIGPVFVRGQAWSVAHCVEAEIDSETLKSIVVRSRSVLTSPDLLEGRLRRVGAQLLAGSSQVEQSG